MAPALGHSFGEATVTKAATCEAEGEKTQTCATCNETVTEVIAKVAHNIANPTDSKASTLSEAGYIKGLCSLCNKDVTADTPAGLMATFDGATSITDAFAAFANDFTIKAKSASGATITDDGKLSAVASPAISLIDNNGVLMSGKFEISFDLLLNGSSGGTAVISLNNRDNGGEQNEMRILSEYSGRLAFCGNNYEHLEVASETPTWKAVKIIVDPTNYDYEIYLDGVKVLYTEYSDTVGNHKVYVSMDGIEYAESTKNYSSTKVCPFNNVAGKIEAIYLFHYVKNSEKIIDNFRVAMIAE